MFIFLIVLFTLICYGLSVRDRGFFNEDYLDKRNTAAVNGIFVILVVFSHYSQYALLEGAFDAPYLVLKSHLNQMVVATFLFYSGYGMMEQVKRRGSSYTYNIPVKSGRLLFRFDAAVMLFLLVNTLLGKSFELKTVVLSLIGWESLGNSNWYIFDILVLYMLMFASFGILERMKTIVSSDNTDSITKDVRDFSSIPSSGYSKDGTEINSIYPSAYHKRLPKLVLFLILTLCFIYAMNKTDKEPYWYNTVILLPAGCFYSEFRDEIERLICKNEITYFLSLFMVLVVYVFSSRLRDINGIKVYTVWAISFISLIILITMKVSIYNRILEWFGKHVFSIYILQRIPMILLDHFGLIDEHKYLCLIAVFALTIPLALIFEKVTELMLNIPAKIASEKELHSKCDLSSKG